MENVQVLCIAWKREKMVSPCEYFGRTHLEDSQRHLLVPLGQDVTAKAW